LSNLEFISDTERARVLLAQKACGEASPQADEGLRNMGIAFVSLLPRVFGQDLDRMTLWSRIASALDTARAKTVGSDIEFYISMVLDHIKADHGRVASTEMLADAISELVALNETQREALMTYLSTRSFVVLAHARKIWNARKEVASE